METQPFIRIRRLKKVFQMGRQTVVALAGVDVDIPQNSFSVIMGPSGSGKSTLLYLLGGLDRPTSGQIFVDHDDIAGMDENALAVYRSKTIGFVFQSFNLLPSMNAIENVAFPMRFNGISAGERTKRAQKLLAQVGLDKHMHHKPTEMSGGQQQRVAVARSLVNDPSLILADEPTGNLDTQTGMSIMHLLVDLHRDGRTVVVVTHDPRMVRFATHTIYILDGHVVSEEDFKRAEMAL